MLADSGFRFVTETNNSGDPTQGAKLTDATSGWSSFSTQTVKQDIAPVDSETILAGVEELDICEWSYESAPGVDHVGPMAEDFTDTFAVGESDKHIDRGDADGVALAAIQGLAEKLDRKDERLRNLEAEIDDLEAENELLRERLSAVEDRLTSWESGESPPAAADD